MIKMASKDISVPKIVNDGQSMSGKAFKVLLMLIDYGFKLTTLYKNLNTLMPQDLFKWSRSS